MTTITEAPSHGTEPTYECSKGFTLVEILVVMAILGIALSLVGPFTINQLDNLQRAEEREQIRLLLNEWQFQAFNQRSALELKFSGSELLVSRTTSPTRFHVNPNRQLAQYNFAFSQFPVQSVTINAHGYANSVELRLNQDGRNYTLSIHNIGSMANNEARALEKPEALSDAPN